MKKLLPVLLVFFLSFSLPSARAQAFDRNTRMISIAIGGADMFHIPVGYDPAFVNFYAPITGEFLVQGEFAIHRYVGLGFTTGIGGRGGGIVNPNGIYRGYYPELNIPIGFIANFHFYQMIGDNSKKNIHSDKLDIYVGASIGTGIAIHPGGYYDYKGRYYNGAYNDILFFLGPQVGIRYFFNPRVGINGEFGFGKTFASFGMTFKLAGRNQAKTR